MNDDEFILVNHRGIDFMINKDGVVKTYKVSLGEWTVCNPYFNHDNYLVVSGYNSVKKCSVTVGIHILMAKAFIPNPDNLPEVNHKDFDRSNYALDNLEWTTHRDNVLYSRAANRYPKNLGETNPNYGNHKLSERYKEDKEYAKKKQGRPMGQNGKAKKCKLIFLDDNSCMEFSCQREAYQFLCDSGKIFSNKYPETVIKKLRQEDGYCGYKIVL